MVGRCNRGNFWAAEQKMGSIPQKPGPVLKQFFFLELFQILNIGVIDQVLSNNVEKLLKNLKYF